MDAHRQIPLRGQLQLSHENFLLTGVRQIRFPAIQADLSDGGGRLIEELDELFLPVGRALLDVPRVIAEAGEDSDARGLVCVTSQRQHLRPILFARPVHDHAGHAFFRAG